MLTPDEISPSEFLETWDRLKARIKRRSEAANSLNASMNQDDDAMVTRTPGSSSLIRSAARSEHVSLSKKTTEYINDENDESNAPGVVVIPASAEQTEDGDDVDDGDAASAEVKAEITSAIQGHGNEMHGLCVAQPASVLNTTSVPDSLQQVFQNILEQQRKMEMELDDMRRTVGSDDENISPQARSRSSSISRLYSPLPPPKVEAGVNEDTFNDPTSSGFEWSTDHVRLLYIIWSYTHTDPKIEKKTETFIRKIPLLVLVYEAIINHVLDYDYAPTPESVHSRCMYLNISQEGKDDIDDLREGGFINGLKLSNKEHTPITAYRLSKKGYELMNRLTDEDRAAVDSVIRKDGHLVEVVWREDEFYLETPDGYSVKSSITDCEDVSYVSSPYLPDCLRKYGGKPTTDNSHKAIASASGSDNIKDDLDEIITLDKVRVIIGEWLPFGVNQVVALNKKLGSSERVQGGLFTALVDGESDGTVIELETALTQVSILDFDEATYLNFEAEVFFPEEEGIVQVENFGVHVPVDGTIFFGLKIEALQDRILDGISLDRLARLLVDVYTDSSMIMDSLLSSYQRDLLGTMFPHGSQLNRDKFAVIIADGIHPYYKAYCYMDKEERENELKQVIGETQAAHDLGHGEILILGEHGILLVGDMVNRHEETVIAYLSLQSKHIFMSNFFSRHFALMDVLQTIRSLIDKFDQDPNSIPRIRRMLSITSRELVQLEEMLGYLRESLSIHPRKATVRDAPAARLQELFAIDKLNDEMVRRVQDMQKNVASAKAELTELKGMADVVSEIQMFKVQEAVQANTKNLEEVFRSNERASNSLEMLQVIMSGTLAFELTDHVVGGWSVIDQPWAQTLIVGPLMSWPFSWFLVNLLLWGIIAMALLYSMRSLASRSGDVLTLRLTPNRKIKVEQLHKYLAKKPVAEEVERESHTKKISWTEVDDGSWGGSAPRIELTYNERHGYLLKVQKNQNGRYLREQDLEQRFFEELRVNDVLDGF